MLNIIIFELNTLSMMAALESKEPGYEANVFHFVYMYESCNAHFSALNYKAQCRCHSEDLSGFRSGD